MQVTITGHHLPITDAIHSYVEQKLAKAWRHFDHGIQAHVVLSVERLDQKAEVTVHLQGKDLHAESPTAISTPPSTYWPTNLTVRSCVIRNSTKRGSTRRGGPARSDCRSAANPVKPAYNLVA